MLAVRLAREELARELAEAAPTDAQMETLARIAHRRWMADRIDAGWRHGATRDDLRRIHPGLVPFDGLSASDQDKDRGAARALIAATRSAGYRIVRRDAGA